MKQHLTWLVLVLLLAACGAGEAAPTTTPIFAGSATPIEISPETCGRSALENWLQRSNGLMFELRELLNSNVATPPNMMGRVMDQAVRVRSAVTNVAYPACAALHYNLIDEATRLAVNSLRDYSENRPLDFMAFITDINARLDAIAAEENNLGALYKTLPPS